MLSKCLGKNFFILRYIPNIFGLIDNVLSETSLLYINYDKGLQIYFSCVKRQAKNDFLKDVERTVVINPSACLVCAE